MSTTKALCEALLGANTPLNAAELAEACGESEKSVSGSLIPLVNCGAVERILGKDGARHSYQVKDQEKVSKRANRGTATAAPAKTKRAKGAKRKTTKPNKSKRPRAKKRAAKKAPARKAAAVEPVLTYFIDEEGDVQIMRVDGEGETAVIPRADAVRLSAFLLRVRTILEPA